METDVYFTLKFTRMPTFIATLSKMITHVSFVNNLDFHFSGCLRVVH